MSGPAYVIVNADDFGMSHAVNLGIADAHDRGIVTSASLMVLRAAAPAAAALAARRPRLGLGLHIDLGEWAWDGGRWRTVYERVPSGDADAVSREIDRQVVMFRDLVGRDPSHLDSHQNVHLAEPVRGVVLGLARRLEVPVRACTPGVRYCGAFHGRTGTGESLPGAVEVDAMLRILESVAVGVTELACHPSTEPASEPGYGKERAIETLTLCAPHVRAAIGRRRITLCTFEHPEVRRCTYR